MKLSRFISPRVGIAIRLATMMALCATTGSVHAGITGLTPPTEAETALIAGGVTSNANTGFTGTGYVQFVGEGSIEWTVNVPRDGLYQLEFRYALASGNRPLNIRNDSFTFNKSNVAFNATGSLSNWGTVDLYAKLNAGNNTIRAESNGSGLPNMDHLLVTITPPDQNKFLTFPIHSTDIAFRGSSANADAYYAAVDPAGSKNTLNNWKAQNGFTPGSTPFHARYFNGADLAFGRAMYVIKWRRTFNKLTGYSFTPDPTCSVETDLNCNISSYVQNYPSLQDAINGTNLIATVAMEYSPRLSLNSLYGNVFVSGKPKFTKFYVFNAAGTRVNRADLDGRGEKFVPGLCNVCHGGKPKLNGVGASNPGYADGGDTGAHWIPWDLDTYDFAASGTYSLANQQAAFKNLNKALLESSPTSATINLVHGWYGGAAMPNANFNGAYVPSGWSSTLSDGNKSTLYAQVFAPACRACHYQREVRNNSGHVIFQGELLENTLTFSTFDNFKKYKKEIEALVYDAGVMPVAKRTYENFWRSNQAVVLDNELFGGIAMQNPPAAIQARYTYDFGAWRRPGRPIPNVAGIPNVLGMKTATSPGSVCFQGNIYDVPDIRGAQDFKLNAASSLFANSFNWAISDYPNSCFTAAAPTINNATSANASLTPDPARSAPYYVKLAISNEFSPSTNQLVFARTWVNNSLPALNFIKDVYPMFNTNYSSTAGHTLSCVHCHSNGNVVNHADGVFNLMDFAEPASADDGSATISTARKQFAYRMALTRIDCNNPENSLLLRKPSGHVHYNGTVSGFENLGNSDDVNNRAKMLRWIMEGAMYTGTGTYGDLGCKPPLRFIPFPFPITPIVVSPLNP